MSFAPIVAARIQQLRADLGDAVVAVLEVAPLGNALVFLHTVDGDVMPVLVAAENLTPDAVH